MKSAHYHQENQAPQVFLVLAEHDDGTVDLGTAEGTLVIGRCQVAAQPRPGQCTLEDTADTGDADPLDSLKVDELRARAGELGIASAGLKKAELISAIKAQTA